MFDDIIRKYSTRYNVPELWIRAVIQTESSWNPTAFRSTSPRDTSYGLMQLTIPTATALGYSGDPEGLFAPDTNIQLGTLLLSQLRTSYGDDVSAIYSAYNSGSPTKYLSSSQVATNVAHFIANFTSLISSEPLVATGGGLGTILVALLVWYWIKRKGK
jgi:soluble lytic murein transglycosylase-like protein